MGFVIFLYIKFVEFTALLNAPVPVAKEGFTANALYSYFVDSGSVTNRKVAALASLLLNGSSSKYNVLFAESLRPFTTRSYIYYDPDVQPTSAGKVAKQLEKELSLLGFSSSIISYVGQIETIPPNSMLIIPSDFLPPKTTEYLPQIEDKGGVVVFISTNPTKQLDRATLAPLDISAFWTDREVSFSPSSARPEGLNMKFTRYVLEKATQLVGGGAFLTYSGNAVYVFVPASVGANMENYWDSEQSAIEDLVKVIDSVVLSFFGENSEQYELEGDSIVYVEKEAVSQGSPEPEERIDAIARVDSGSAHRYISFSVARDYPGSIYFQKEMPIIPYSISKQPSLMEITLDPNSIGNAQVLLEVQDTAGKVLDRVEVNSLQPLPKSVGIEVRYYNEDLPEGRYLLTLLDYRTGKVYARTFLEIGKLEVRANPDFDKAIINFQFLVGGRPTQVGKGIVRFNDREYEFSNVEEFSLDLFDVFKGPIPAGTYTFEVEVQGTEPQVITVTRSPRTGILTLLSPRNIVLLVISGLIYGVGFIIKRREEMPYSVDIPDFAPVEYETLELSEEDLVKSFELVNEYYRWRLTPLNLEEIKKGISLLIGRKDVVINDFNLEIVLEELVKKGKLVSKEGYYLPKKWLSSGFTIEQLVSFRKIRDVCVDLAIPFKPLSKSLPNTKLSLPWQEFWIYLYSGFNKEAITKAAIKNVSEPNVSQVIIFYDESDLDRFEQQLVDGSKTSSLLRSYIENEAVFAFTVDEFIKKLKELKS